MALRNPFAALQTDDDEVDGQVAAPAPVAKEVKAAAPAAAKQQPAKSAPREGGKSAGAPREARKEGAPRPPRQGGERKPQHAPKVADDAVVGADHHGERGPREHQSHRHVAGGDKRSGHEGSSFRNERHSHQKQNKESGKSGDRVWGNAKDAHEQQEAVVDSPAVDAESAAPAPASGEAEAPVEDGSQLLSLDEYRRQQKERRAQAPALPARKAGEGEDKSKWAAGQELVVKEETAEEAAAAAERKVQRSAKKQTLEINVQFQTETSRGGGDDSFRGRGRGRGGSRGGRGGPRTGSRSDAPKSAGHAAAGFKVSDDDFPSL